MTKQIITWVAVLIFIALTSYIVVADGVLEDILNDTEEIIKDEVISIGLDIERDNPELKDNLNGYIISPIDCATGKFHVYKEGELDRDLTIECNETKDDSKLKELVYLELNKNVEEYKVVRGLPIEIIHDIRLEKVRLIKEGR